MFSFDKISSNAASLARRLRHLRCDSPGVISGPQEEIPHGDIPTLFEEQVATLRQRNDNRPAVTYLEKTLSFDDLNRRANVFARLLKEELASENGKRSMEVPLIAVFIPASDVRLVALLAIFKLRAAYLPLEGTLPPQRIELLLLGSGVKYVLYQSSQSYTSLTEATAFHHHIRLINADKLLSDSNSDIKTTNLTPKELHWPAEEDPLVAVLYTSGSTGTPKGVPIRTRNLLNRLTWQWQEFPFTETEVGCHKTPLLFVDSLTEITGCLLKGVGVVVLPREITQNLKEFVQAVIKYKVSRLVVVPSHLNGIIEYLRATHRRFDSPSLKMIVSSGEALRSTTASAMFTLFPDRIVLVNLYGSTETTGDVCYQVFKGATDVEENSLDGVVSIGRPINNTVVVVLDDEGHPVSNGLTGKIHVCGANITEGYFDKGNTESFVPNDVCPGPGRKTLYKMGDIGVIMNHKIFYQGREDSQVKVRGHRINLREVDETLFGLPGIEQVVTLPYENKSGDLLPVAFYRLDPETDLEESKILDVCQQHFPEYMVPRLFKLQSLPLQPHTGKVDRQRLIQIYTDQLQSECNPWQHERIESEADILRVIASNISVPSESLKCDASFFSNGGNSISAVTTVAELNQHGCTLSITDFIRARTIRELVETIQDGPPDDGDTPQTSDNDNYKVCPLNEAENPDSVITLMATAFSEKNPLDMLVGTSKQSLETLFKSIWREIVTDDLSVAVVEKKSQRIVGVLIALDIHTDIEPAFDSVEVEEINNAVENPVKEKLMQEGGRWMDAMLNAVETSIPEETSFTILRMMEDYIIDLARSRGYDGIVTANSHPVTMEIAEREYGYETWNTLRVRTFNFRGSYPFASADDNYVIKAMVKRLK